jgi:DNA-binding NtrC family response regulator
MNERNGKNVQRFEDAAIQLMHRYNWPGNVRELVNVVERAVVLSQSEVIGVDDLPESLRREDPNRNTVELPGGPRSLRNALVAPERQIILNALETNGWNRQKTSAALGINRTTLYKKMKKYEISFEHQLMHS